MKKIIFICYGNICRSTMAEFVFKDMVNKKGLNDKFEIKSAATSTENINEDIHPGTQKKLNEVGVPFTHRLSVQFKKSDYDLYDYIVCMDELNYNDLLKIVGHDKEQKIAKLLSFAGESADIADPWFTDDFDATYNDVYKGCKALLEKLEKEI